MNKKDIKKLLNWYQNSKRDLPWRHTKDPYKIWISETMLQQTRVETVIPYYNNFLESLPTIKDLANVKEDKLLKLWEGLGYYSRARNLQKTAKIIIENQKGTLPDSKEELENLPGIGPYTVGAILSIAYSQEEPAIDGNVMRVLSRVYEEKEDISKKKVREKYYVILKKLMKKENPSDFTQSFIELGALICTKNPSCTICPLQNCCKSYKHHTVLEYPIKKKKKEKPNILKTVFIFEYQNTYMIRKRNEEGILANLYEFPNVENFLTKDELESFLKRKKIAYTSIQELGEVTHIFSHQKWLLRVYLISLKKKVSNNLFVTKKELQEIYSLPTVFQKAWNLKKESTSQF